MPTSSRLVAKDLFVDNEVYNLVRASYPEAFELGGIAWLRREPPKHAHVNALTTALAALAQALPAYQLVLFVAAPSVDSAVGRYRKLWGALEAGGVRIPQGRRTEATDDGGLGWRAAIIMDSGDAAEAIAFIKARPLSLLVAVPPTSPSEVDAVVARGWTRAEQGPSTEIVRWVCSNAGIAFWPVGGFDDPESGIVGFCPPALITDLDFDPAVKDEDAAHPIATAWREPLRQIANAIARRDSSLDPALAERIQEYVATYGETLTDLPDDTWSTSQAQWMGDHWEVLVDLWTVESGASDLVLHARVFESDAEVRIVIDSVHVP